MNQTKLAFAASLVFLCVDMSFSQQIDEIAQDRKLRIQHLFINDEPDENRIVQRLRIQNGRQILLNDLLIDQTLVYKTQEDKFRLEFDRRIEELNEICKLSPSQLKKLHVASKGAIQKTIEGQSKNNENQIEELVQNRIVFNLGTIQSTDAPFRQPIWVNTIRKILNDDQRQLLDAHEKEQNAKRRRANVVSYLGQLDNLLKFNSDQRNEIYNLIDEKFGKHFESIEKRRAFLDALVPAQLMQAADVEEKMKEILSNEQLEIWNVYAKVGVRQQLLLNQNEVAQFPNRPMLGVRLVNDIDGAAVHSVIPNSPADKAGLQAGDVFRSIDDDEILQLQDVMTVIRNKKPNAKIQIVIVRNGEEKKLETTLVLGKDLQ